MSEQAVDPLPDRAGEHSAPAAVASARRFREAAWAVATALFAVALPLLLITGSVRLIINSSQLYEWDFSRYDIESRTGLARDELRSAARQIVDYFNNSDEFLDVRVSFGDGDVSLYREREVLHMRDVKTLVRGVFAVLRWTLIYAAVFVAAGFALRRRLFLPLLRRGVLYSAGATLLVVLGLGAAALINFDAVFTQFHQLSFTNNLWQLDPYRDYLLIMFPEGFFLDATLAIAAFTIAGFALIAAAVWWLARRYGPLERPSA